jgi:hypothetical protein
MDECRIYFFQGRNRRFLSIGGRLFSSVGAQLYHPLGNCISPQYNRHDLFMAKKNEIK